MLHSATDTVTDHEVVAGLHCRLGNMEAISRETGVPSKNLWEARAKPAYKFRHGVYRRRVHALYTSVFAIPRFDAWTETRLDELRAAFAPAVLPKSDPASSTHELADFIERYGPALRAADWTSPRVPAGIRYLYASALLAAERARLSGALVKAWLGGEGDPIDAAIAHFDAELLALAADPEARGLRARVLTARASAALWKRAKQGAGGNGIGDVLSRAECGELLDHHRQVLAALPAGHPRAWSTALLVVHIASALGDRAACLAGYERLVAERPAFRDADHPEWSQLGPAHDPDLVFFRRDVHPTLAARTGDQP